LEFYPSPLRILVVNCQSIKNKKQELENLVETSKPDIMIGTESWLSNDIQSTEIFPSGFTPYDSVPIMMSGFDVSTKFSSSCFLFLID
jgi:hypothetical protein